MLVYGLYSKKWQDAQEEWIQKKSTKWKRSTKKWSIKLVTASLELAWKMWENRNEYLHSDKHHWNLETEEQLNTGIREAFNQATNVLARDKFLWGKAGERIFFLPVKSKVDLVIVLV